MKIKLNFAIFDKDFKKQYEVAIIEIYMEDLKMTIKNSVAKNPSFISRMYLKNTM
ncbi:MAG: hypothetical protein FWF81_07370 [Defluviitaleaceae bacterium]|nr:hypothetical protein [Defluviitaleaceae bacterium]